MNLHTAGGRAGRLLLAGSLPRSSWRCRPLLASSLWPCFNRKQKVLWQQEGATFAGTNAATVAAPAQTPSAVSAWCVCHCPVLLPRVPSGPLLRGHAAGCAVSRCRCGTGCAWVTVWSWSCPVFISSELCGSSGDSGAIRSCPTSPGGPAVLGELLAGCSCCGLAIPASLREEGRRMGLLAGSNVGDGCTGMGRRVNWCTSNGCRMGTCLCPSSLLFPVSGHLHSSQRGWMQHPEHPAQGRSDSSEERTQRWEQPLPRCVAGQCQGAAARLARRRGGTMQTPQQCLDFTSPSSACSGSPGWRPGWRLAAARLPARGGLSEDSFSACTL